MFSLVNFHGDADTVMLSNIDTDEALCPNEATKYLFSAEVLEQYYRDQEELKGLSCYGYVPGPRGLGEFKRLCHSIRQALHDINGHDMNGNVCNCDARDA